MYVLMDSKNTKNYQRMQAKTLFVLLSISLNLLLGCEPKISEPLIRDEQDQSSVEPDMALVEPDMALVEPDMELVEPDMALVESDMALVEPDMELIEPDMELIEPDMELVEPDMELVEPDMELVEPDMELVEPCAEGYYDHDGDPNSDCIPLWSAPSIQITIPEYAWLGESYTFSIQVNSEDPQGYEIEWSQEGGRTQAYLVDAQDSSQVHIEQLLGEHQEEISFVVQVSDSLGQSTQATVSFILNDRIFTALEQGDPRFLPNSDQDLLSQIIQEIERLQNTTNESLAYLFAEQAISYDPSRHSQFFTPLSLSEVSPLLIGNGGKLLAAKYEQDGLRAAAFGTNIFAKVNGGQLANFDQVLQRLLLWLTQQEGDQALPISPQNIKLVGLNAGASQQVLNYLQASYPTWPVVLCELNDMLTACLSNADLIILGTQNIEDYEWFINQIRDLVSPIQAQTSTRPALLYTHQHSWNSNVATVSLLELLGLSIQGSGGPGNYFAQDSAQWNNAQEMLLQASALANLKNMAQHFQNESFSFDLSLCEGDCRGNQAFVDEFSEAARLVRSQNQNLAQKGQKLFDLSGERLHKLLVLLGDKWRETVEFPQSKDSTDPITFLKSYYADHSHLISREINPIQSDLGDFSRSDFSHIQTIDVTKTYVSKAPFRSAQVYALPGQSFTVERLAVDEQGQELNQELKVWLQINSLRNSSVHEFDRGGYTRPKFMTSHRVALKAGETMSFTSAYGGPIQLRFEQADIPLSLRFTGVAQHPVWSSASDDVSFAQALTSGDFDWVEFITPHFEIHSTLTKMRTTFESPLFATGSELAELIRTYHHGYALAMAGYQGPEIVVIPEITEFINQKGWPLPERNVVQHFNADKPTCGYGCSGNPYDAGWAFSPLGHGDLHEVGHNHERGRFKFNNREGHATTNYYSYFPKQQHALDTGIEADCQQLPFQALFDKLQDAQLTQDPFATMSTDQSLNGWSQGVSVVIQALMAAERMGQISRGWYLIGRLHAHERAFRAALNNDETWLAQRSSLGFEALSRQEANNLSNNDYLFVALCTVSELNYEAFFEIWGLTVMDTLKQSIRAHGYSLVPQVFYAAEAKSACSTWDAREIPIDGQSLWLDLSQFDRQSVNLTQSYLSEPYQSQESSVYFVTIDADIGPTQRVWWGNNGALTELYLPVMNQAQTHSGILTIDAYQQRCDTLMTLNAGRVGGCEHRLLLEIDPIKNTDLLTGESYSSQEQLPLILEAWRWHEPVEKLDTLVLNVTYSVP